MFLQNFVKRLHSNADSIQVAQPIRLQHLHKYISGILLILFSAISRSVSAHPANKIAF